MDSSFTCIIGSITCFITTEFVNGCFANNKTYVRLFGLTQLTSGLPMGFVGIQPQIGLLLTLISSISSMVLIFTIGIVANHFFMRQMRIPS